MKPARFDPGRMRHELTIIPPADDNALAAADFAESPAGGELAPVIVKAEVRRIMGDEETAAKDTAIRSVYRYQIITRQENAEHISVNARVSTPAEGEMRIIDVARMDALNRYIIAQAESVR